MFTDPFAADTPEEGAKQIESYLEVIFHCAERVLAQDSLEDAVETLRKWAKQHIDLFNRGELTPELIIREEEAIDKIFDTLGPVIVRWLPRYLLLIERVATVQINNFGDEYIDAMARFQLRVDARKALLRFPPEVYSLI